MAQNLNQSIQKLNEKTLKKELIAARLMKNELESLIKKNLKIDSPDTAKQPQNISLAGNKIINEMLQTDSKEEFFIHKKRFDNLIAQLKEKLAPEGNLDSSAESNRFYQQLQIVLKDLTKDNSKEMEVFLPQWLKHPDYADWEKKLNALRCISDKTAFESHKSKLMTDLYKQLDNAASLVLLESNSHLLAETRLSYLKEMTNRKKMVGDLSWIVAGSLIVTAVAVLGFAFPFLVIPGLVVGALALGYGVIDFSKESTEFISDITTKEMDEHEIASDTINEAQKDGLDLEKKHSSDKKWLRGLGAAVAFTGFALALAGLVFIIPGIVVPIAAIIVVTALAVAVAGLAAALWGYKVGREQKGLNTLEQKVEKEINEDNKIMNEVTLINGKTDKLSSTAKVIKEELDHYKKQTSINQLKSELPEHEEEKGDDIRKESYKDLIDFRETKQPIKEDDENDKDEDKNEMESV